MKPPAAGPTIEASPNDAPITPWYLPRSRGETLSPMMAWDRGIRKPMPAPCTKRAKTRNQKFGARPDSIEPSAKTTTPVVYRGLPPEMSEYLPETWTTMVDAGIPQNGIQL